MPPPSRICYVDFDHTLFDTDRFFHVDAQQRFLELGIDAKLWEQTYWAVFPLGYTLERHVEEISKHSQGRFALPRLKKILRDDFSDLRRYLFADVIPFLEKAPAKGVKLAILSFGHPDWQKYKVEACRIQNHFDFVFFTEGQNRKADVVRERAKEFEEMIVVDNHAFELDAVKDLDVNVQTYWMNRVPTEGVLATLPPNSFLEARKYAGMIPRHRHHSCTTLDDVILE